MKTLDEIGVECGTDKAAGVGYHDYCGTYQELFEEWRDLPITMLELGWGGYAYPKLGGNSAAMWREYFSKASINVIDIAPKVCTVPGVQLFCGAQDDEKFLAEVHAQTGDYDIIIDDASHESTKTLRSHTRLWPYLRSGGYYIVEDLIVQMVALRRFVKLAEEHLRMMHDDIESITFYHQLVVIEKK